MDVYFGNFWRKKREPDEQPGLPVSVDKYFEYGGFTWVCPRIYLCKEGIVLDLCRKCDAAAFRLFYEKWVDRIDTLTPDEQEQISKENPMNFLCDFRLNLDGKRLEGGGFSGMGWLPDFPEQNDGMSEMLMKEYALSREFGWYIYRARFPFQPKDYASLAEDSDLLKRLTLRVAAGKEQIYFDTRITTKVDCEPFDIELKHPLTGERHRFFVGACSAESFDKMPAQLKQDMIIPENHCVLVYAVAPEFSAEQFFSVQDCARGDSPIRKPANPENAKAVNGAKAANRAKAANGEKAAASIGIIGSADGPTSFFLAGKIGGKSEILEKAKAANADKEVNWKTVCSALTFEPVKEVTWKCSIQVAPFAPMEIPFFAEQAKN